MNSAATIHEIPRIVTGELVRAILDGYVLNPRGIHGLGHWARVLINGLIVAAESGADTDVVALFAVFHDARRRNDAHDPGHGPRGATLANELRGRSFHLDDKRFKLLQTACRGHTCESTHADVTVRTCWDADRLDLARVGTIPDPRYLCTKAARRPAVIEAAMERSATRRDVPEIVRGAWGIVPA